MVGRSMDGPGRDRVLLLINRKEHIEHEIRELNMVLEANENVGMHSPLVDNEGYPRNDIDVYRVRHARHRILCLQNDHKEVMNLIENGIHSVHQEFVGSHGEGTSRSNLNQAMDIADPENPGPADANANGNAAPPMTNGYHHCVGEDRVSVMEQATRNLRVSSYAFALVTYVSANSPAEDAGLCRNDEILNFGTLNSSNFRNLGQIIDLIVHSVGTRVDVRVRRGEALMSLSLTPRAWAGDGYMGCLIRPVHGAP